MFAKIAEKNPRPRSAPSAFISFLHYGQIPGRDARAWVSSLIEVRKSAPARRICDSARARRFVD